MAHPRPTAELGFPSVGLPAIWPRRAPTVARHINKCLHRPAARAAIDPNLYQPSPPPARRQCKTRQRAHHGMRVCRVSTPPAVAYDVRFSQVRGPPPPAAQEPTVCNCPAAVGVPGMRFCRPPALLHGRRGLKFSQVPEPPRGPAGWLVFASRSASLPGCPAPARALRLHPHVFTDSPRGCPTSGPGNGARTRPGQRPTFATELSRMREPSRMYLRTVLIERWSVWSMVLGSLAPAARGGRSGRGRVRR